MAITAKSLTDNTNLKSIIQDVIDEHDDNLKEEIKDKLVSHIRDSLCWEDGDSDADEAIEALRVLKKVVE